MVGKYIQQIGITSIIVVTSKYHTRRARLAFRGVLPDTVSVTVVGTRFDSYNPWKWWWNSDTVRHVIHEYGGLIYYRVKLLFKDYALYDDADKGLSATASGSV